MVENIAEVICKCIEVFEISIRRKMNSKEKPLHSQTIIASYAFCNCIVRLKIIYLHYLYEALFVKHFTVFFIFILLFIFYYYYFLIEHFNLPEKTSILNYTFTSFTPILILQTFPNFYLFIYFFKIHFKSFIYIIYTNHRSSNLSLSSCFLNTFFKNVFFPCLFIATCYLPEGILPLLFPAIVEMHFCLHAPVTGRQGISGVNIRMLFWTTPRLRLVPETEIYVGISEDENMMCEDQEYMFC